MGPLHARLLNHPVRRGRPMRPAACPLRICLQRVQRTLVGLISRARWRGITESQGVACHPKADGQQAFWRNATNAHGEGWHCGSWGRLSGAKAWLCDRLMLGGRCRGGMAGNAKPPSRRGRRRSLRKAYALRGGASKRMSASSGSLMRRSSAVSPSSSWGKTIQSEVSRTV